MLELAGNVVALRKTRLRSAERDRLRARQLFERALANADCTPAELPPRAILFVRKLVPSARLHFAGSNDAFGLAVRTEIARTLQHARRPWIHGNATFAPAVVFLDEAELAACLIRDWLTGCIAEHWWWREVLESTSAAQWLRRHVLTRGEVFAATTELLAARGDAIAWCSRIDMTEAEIAHRALVARYGISVEAALAIDGSGDMDRTAAPLHFRETATGSHAQFQALRRLVEIAPESVTLRLNNVQRALYAMALIVRRHLEWARTVEAAQALAEYRAAPFGSLCELERSHAAAQVEETAHRQSATVNVERSLLSRLRQDPVEEQTPVTPEQSATDARSCVASALTSVAAPDAVSASAAESMAHDSSITADRTIEMERVTTGHASNAPRTGLALQSPQTIVLPSAAADAKPPAQSDAEALESAPIAIERQEGVPTDFGGVFYLLHVALALGLYGDFTMPRTPGLSLSPWDWLALVGRRWFGREFEQDPLWKCLAKLTGRSNRVPPGRDFRPATDWIVPIEWLAPFGPVDRLTVNASKRRMQLSHSAGFVVADVRREATSLDQQARRLCRRLGIDPLPLFESSACGPIARAGHVRGRWLDRVLGYVQARLALALQIDATETASFLCRHRAHIYMSTNGVDVTFGLAQLPIAIRCAGLDRDPGWIPAAGRDVRFHFE